MKDFTQTLAHRAAVMEGAAAYQARVLAGYVAVKHLPNDEAAAALGRALNTVYAFRRDHPEARPVGWMTGSEQKAALRAKQAETKAAKASHRKKPDTGSQAQAIAPSGLKKRVCVVAATGSMYEGNDMAARMVSLPKEPWL